MKANQGWLSLFQIFSITCLIIYTCISFKFVWYDNITTFASDSANYMLMGLYLSPWKEASEPIQALWKYQDYPSFFPLVLAMTGAVHSMYAAHILTNVFLIVSLPLIYLFSRQCLLTNWQSLFITIIFAISPSTWLNSLGILSENLYLLISLIIITAFPKFRISNSIFCAVIGLLLTMLVLTRTIGISMIIAYVMVGFVMWRQKFISINKYIIPVLVVFVLIMLSTLIRASVVPIQYIPQFSHLDIAVNLNALLEAWFSGWQYYWLDELLIPHLFVYLIGILAFAGLVLRLVQFRLDAIYIFIYLCVLIIWPHPGQAFRFLYPIHAILIIYAFHIMVVFFNRFTKMPATKPVFILLLISFSVVGPTLSYLWNRHQVGKPHGYQHILEFYRFPDLKQASEIASVQITMLDDMNVIRSSTTPEDTILYFTPTYMGLLANRHSQPIPFIKTDENNYQIVIPEKAKYVYLSRIHPKMTRLGINGLDIEIYFKNTGDILWTHNSNEDHKPASMFIAL